MSNLSLKISNLSFNYDEKVVLSGVNLDYDSKDFLSIIGPNGGGKSTLLKLIAGILKPKSGKIEFVKNSEKLKFSPQILSFVPQNIPFNSFFPISVLEVVLMGRCSAKSFFGYKKADKEKALEALEIVGLENFAGRSILGLSGGERQRVYIARALCGDAEILLLDEPTSSIDTKGAAGIYEMLKIINQNGTGIIMVSHDLNLALSFASQAAYVSRSLVMHDLGVASQKNAKFIEHLKGHKHFCSIELALGRCDECGLECGECGLKGLKNA